MTTANTISTLFGKMARISLLKREQRLNHRFLCPNCLHFGGFDFACGKCWMKVNALRILVGGTCPNCYEPLFSREQLEGRDVSLRRRRRADSDSGTLSSSEELEGRDLRAFCRRCKGNYDRPIYHQRRVRVLATLRPIDSASLYQAISGQESWPQNSTSYVYDDGLWLTYVLDLSALTDATRSVPREHALREVESIWLNTAGVEPKALALAIGQTADTFIRQVGLTKPQQKALTVCVRQAALDSIVEHVLTTRFGMVKYEVAAANFLYDVDQAKVMVLREIGQNSATPALIAAYRYRGDWEKAEKAKEALEKIDDKSAVPWLITALETEVSPRRSTERAALRNIGSPAVPELIAALNDSSNYARSIIASVLGDIRDKSAVPSLITALGDSLEEVRQMAAGALEKIGDQSAVPALISALNDNFGEVRCAAAEALGEIGDQSAIPALIGALSDDHYEGKPGDGKFTVRESAAVALRKIGQPSVRPMIAALKDGHWIIVKALGMIGQPAVPELIAMLNDSNDKVRALAVSALVKIGQPAVPALMDMLKDGNGNTRALAAQTLAEMKYSSVYPRPYVGSAVPALIDALKDNDREVRREAVKALESIGDKSAVPALIDALKDGDDEVNVLAVRVLIEFGEAKTLVKVGAPAVPALIAALVETYPNIFTGSYLNHVAADVLVKIGLPAVPALIRTLKNSSVSARSGAAFALGKIGDKSAVPALSDALKDGDYCVRMNAARSLGEIGDKSAVPALNDALNDVEDGVRRQAEWALLRNK